MKTGRGLARAKPGLCLALLAGLAGLLPGCTRESTRIAIETQRRADEVQQAIFDRQHEALCLLLYRDLVQRLEAAHGELSAAQRAVLNEVWNDRDLIEFWGVQHERSAALRIMGVDTKLASDQAMVDLLWKSIAARLDRVQQGLGAYAAEHAAPTPE